MEQADRKSRGPETLPCCQLGLGRQRQQCGLAAASRAAASWRANRLNERRSTKVEWNVQCRLTGEHFEKIIVGNGHQVVRGRSLANVSCLCLPGQCEQFVQISCHWFLKTRSGPGLWGRVASLLHKPDRLLAINRATHLLPTLMIFELLKSTLFGTINRYFNTFIVFV